MKTLTFFFLVLVSSLCYGQSLVCTEQVGCSDYKLGSGIDSAYAVMPSPTDAAPQSVLYYPLNRIYRKGEILRVRVSGIIPDGSNIAVCINLWEGYDKGANYSHSWSVGTIHPEQYYLADPRHNGYQGYILTIVCPSDTKGLVLIRQVWHNNYRIVNGKLTGGEAGYQNGIDALIDDVSIEQSKPIPAASWKYAYNSRFVINSSVFGKSVK